MESFLIISHIVAGGTVLIIGLFNMLNRKGGKQHAILGKIYVGTMWWICLSAVSIITFYRFSFFLMVIAVLTFYSTFIGVRVLKRKKVGTEKWYDWVVAGITAFFGLSLIGYGIYVFVLTESIHVVGILSLIFGTGTFLSGFGDLKTFKLQQPQAKDWWLKQHIKAMGGSYIAAITAFAVQNGDAFLPQNYVWLTWLLPAMILSPMISYFVRKNTKKEVTA